MLLDGTSEIQRRHFHGVLKRANTEVAQFRKNRSLNQNVVGQRHGCTGACTWRSSRRLCANRAVSRLLRPRWELSGDPGSPAFDPHPHPPQTPPNNPTSSPSAAMRVIHRWRGGCAVGGRSSGGEFCLPRMQTGKICHGLRGSRGGEGREDKNV